VVEPVKRTPGNPAYPDSLGVLRVHRYMTPQTSKEMLFFELTWDSIVDKEKQLLSFDYSTEASVKRAPFNHTLKTFINNTIPDALMYNTKYRMPIQLSVAQAICWILSEDWENLPNNQESHCDATDSNYLSQFDHGNFAIISHSLGSRISLDALQESMLHISKRPEYQSISDEFRNNPMYLYMLSNQLPLLPLIVFITFCRTERPHLVVYLR
jgi:hypothetical protein